MTKGPRNPTRGISFKVCSFSSQSYSCYKGGERVFQLWLSPSQSECQWHAYPSANPVHLGAFNQSPHKYPYYLPERCCSNKFSSNIPARKGCSWECCLHLIHAGFSSFILLFRFISHQLPAHNLSLTLLCLKARAYKGKERKWAQRLGG